MYKLNLKESEWQQMMELAHAAKTKELQWFTDLNWTNDGKDIIFTIKGGIFVPSQTASGATVTSSAADYAAMEEEMYEAGLHPKLWVHSHVEMPCFFSPTDITNMGDFMSAGRSMMMGLVVNKKGEHFLELWLNQKRSNSLLGEEEGIYKYKIALEIVKDLTIKNWAIEEVNDKLKEYVHPATIGYQTSFERERKKKETIKNIDLKELIDKGLTGTALFHPSDDEENKQTVWTFLESKRTYAEWVAFENSAYKTWTVCQFVWSTDAIGCRNRINNLVKSHASASHLDIEELLFVLFIELGGDITVKTLLDTIITTELIDYFLSKQEARYLLSDVTD